MTTVTVTLPRLHPSQDKVARHPARFQVLACGRRWGKTRLGALRCIMEALEGKRAWWVAPSYPIASVGWRLIKRLAIQIPTARKSEVDKLISMPGGGSVQVRSADNPDSLRGEGLDFLVVDECAFVKEEAWQEALRPALSDRQGRAYLISTPKGHNWFWRAWQRGHTDTEYQAWQLPTADNPFIEQSEIDAAQESMPERVFAQEFLAQFVDDAGGVFRRVMDAARFSPTPPDADTQYVIGADWGKHEDFTVLSVVDAQRHTMATMERFNQIDYTLQVGRLKALCERYKPIAIIAERNSMGEPLIEQLQRENLPVQAFTTTNASKAQIIDGLALAFERGEIGILNDPVLIGELQAYEMERLPSGLLRYSAPSGMHDDCVMSLALAWFGATAGVLTGQLFY